MGDLSLRAGQPDEARAYFEQALDIRERLARALPDDYEAQRDRGVSCGNMRELAQAEKDQGQIQHWFGQALTTLRGMQQHFGSLTAADEQLLQQLEGMAS